MRQILMKGMGRFQLQNVWCPSWDFLNSPRRDVKFLGKAVGLDGHDFGRFWSMNGILLFHKHVLMLYL